jgi:uncharacterized protein YceK
MRLMGYLASAGLGVLLSGCASNIAPTLTADAAPNTANGVVAGEFSSLATTGVAFILHNTQTNAEYALSLGDKAKADNGAYQQVVAIDVPPGEYVIKQWEAFAPVTKKLYAQSDLTIPLLNKPFTVRAGQVTYLGSFAVSGSETYANGTNRVDETRHWGVRALPVSSHASEVSFAGAYPAYAKSEFTCLMCTEMVAGYTTRVADVRKDPQAYLASQFAPGVMAPEVMNMIRASDNESAHFSHIVMHLTWRYSTENSGTTLSVDEVRTLNHQDGPFVETFAEQFKGGTPIGQTYALTYRNVLDLKNQRLDLAQEFAPPPKEMGVVERFDSMSSIDAGAQFAFSVGTRAPTPRFSAASASCTKEGRVAASSLNASLTGDAIKVVCSYYNGNSQLMTKNRFVYLPQYGVGVQLGVQTARTRGEATLTSITVD